MARSIVVKKRVDLGPLAYGWDDCYLVFSSMSKQDKDSITALQGTDADDDQAEAFIRDYLREHFVSGRIRVTEDGVETLVDASAEDVDQLPMDIISSAFTQITVGGSKYAHPKA